MLSRTTALLIASFALVLGGCESESAPVRTPVPPTNGSAALEQATAEPAAELADPATLLELPREDHALKSLQALDLIPASATVVFATSNPAELAALFAVAPPPEAEFGPTRTPELEDLHPVRLKAIGLDPAKPAGIALAAERGSISASWWVFATVADEEAFQEAFGLEKTAHGYTGETLDLRRFVALDNGEVLIASQASDDTAQPAWLSEDAEFVKLSDALDYGALLTLYTVSRRGGALAGFGATEDGAALRAVATSSSLAATLRLKFAEELAAILPEVPTLQRAVTQSQEFSARGRSLRASITKLEHAPQQRRVAAAKSLLTDVEVLASTEHEGEEIFTVSRRWAVSPAQLAAVYDGWRALGPTSEERVEIADLNLELELVRKEGTSTLSHEDIAKATTEAMMGLTKNPQDTLSKLGPLGAIGDQLLGGDDDGDGPLGALSGLGGLGLGGSGPEPEIVATSKESAIQRHVRGRMTQLAYCWAMSESVNDAVRVRAEVAVDEKGGVKVSNVTGPSDMRSCVRDAINVRARKPDEPLSGTVTISFRFKK